MSSTDTLGRPAPHATTRVPLRPRNAPHDERTKEHSTPAPSTPTSGTGSHDTVPERAELDWSHVTWARVSAAQKGDSEAFGLLYNEYAHVVYRYVLFRVSDHCLAEDITSETFLRALRRIASVTYQGRDVAAWFITIAKNLILDYIKSSRNRFEVPTSDLIDSASDEGRPHQIGPEQHVVTEAIHRELLRCVRQLNPDQRECIHLRFLKGLSVTETAARMQRNDGAIKALQHRAIRRLAQLMPDELR